MSGTYIIWPPPPSGGTGGGGGVVTVGSMDAQPASVNGASIVATQIFMQSATGSNSGVVNITTQSFGGKKTFSAGLDAASNKITSVADPTNPQDASTKNYVDTQLSAFEPKEAAYAATIGNLGGVYANGVAGVGATFTIASTGAFVLDGTSPPALSRILFKDQTTGFQNGIYDLTVVGSGILQPVLTRSLDYNTPAAIDAGDLIPVINGTSNGLTSWLQTNNVQTIGSDSLIFTKYSSNPLNVPITVGALDGAAGSANGATIGSSSLYLQSATASQSGLISVSSQTMGFGDKSFGGNILPIADGTGVVGTASFRFKDASFSSSVTCGLTSSSRMYAILSNNLGSGAGGTLRLGQLGAGAAWLQIYTDGASMQSSDSNGYSLFTFRNNANAFYQFTDPGNNPLFTMNSASLTARTVKMVAPAFTIGSVTQTCAGGTTPYSVTWPNTQASSSSELANDGAGNLFWVPKLGPQVQQFTSGSGTVTIASGCLWIKVQMVGAGGGGGASGLIGSGSFVAAIAGTQTTLGSGTTTVLICNGGALGTSAGNFPANGGTGGLFTISSSYQGLGVIGGQGGPLSTASGSASSSIYFMGGMGGSAPFFGGGAAASLSVTTNGIANTGGGGGGGSVNPPSLGFATGGGGGGGSYIEAILYNPPTSFSYTIGSGGAGGTTVTGVSGGHGASGNLIVWQYFY